MGMWVPVWRGQVHIIPQPRLPESGFLVLAGTLSAVTTAVLQCSNFSPYSLPDMPRRMIFQWRA